MAEQPVGGVVAGTLDLLILKTVALEPMHGWGVGRRIEQVTGFRLKLGSLYPALERLEAAGEIEAEWRLSDNNRRARYYRLTAIGRKRLAAEIRHWRRRIDGILRLIEAT
ncbi:MAG: PadR family transcriptional regulator [Gemmatimonadales bacterium]